MVTLFQSSNYRHRIETKRVIDTEFSLWRTNCSVRSEYQGQTILREEG